MRVQVLSSVMNKNSRELVEQMNLETDAVIINQCDTFSLEKFDYKGRNIEFYSFADRGIGKSRNEAILRASGDICLFSDEDIVYNSGYEQAIVQEFESNPKADIIIFNINVVEDRRTYWNTDRKRVHWYNSGRYGAVSFAVRRDSLLRSQVMFSLLFGGGAKYSSGEDNLFLMACIKKGLKVYKAPVEIGKEVPRESTWFNGYNEKYFYDRGVLYKYLYGGLARLFAFRFVFTKRKVMCTQIPWKKAYGLMVSGIHEEKGEK